MGATKNVAPSGDDSIVNQQNQNTYALICRCLVNDVAVAR